MRIPTYDGLQVGLNTLPQPRMQPGEVVDTAGRQAQAVGQSMQQAGQEAGRLALQMQEQDNDARLNGKLNAMKEESIRLEHDKEVGFRMQKGENALKRPDNKSLEDEYSESLNQYMDSLMQDLPPALASRFQAQAQGMVISLRERAMVHRNQEFEKHNLAQNEAIINTAAREIAINPGDDKVLESAMSRIRASVGQMADIAGHPPEWKENAIRKATSGAITAAIGQLVDKDPHGASAYLDKHLDKMDFADVTRVREVIQIAVENKNADDAADAIYSGAEPTGTPVYQTGGKGARGIRNNNPGNIVKSGIQWSGQVQGNDSRFVSFRTPQAGIAALGKNLIAYQTKHGLSTVRGIIGRWAPPNENNTGAYVNKVAKEMGVDADARLNLRDPATLQALTVAIIRHENGGNPYSKEVVSGGVAAALGRAALPATATTSAPTTKPAQSGKRSLGAMLAQADAITNPRERERTKAQIRSRFAQDDAAEKEQYGLLLERSAEAAFQYPGAYVNIPSADWQRLKPEDREKLKAGLPKADDPQLMFALTMNPALLREDVLLGNRHLMTESTFRQLMGKVKTLDSEQKVLAVSFDAEHFKDVMNKAGLGDMLQGTAHSTVKAEVTALKTAIDFEIDAQQKARGRTLTMDEKLQIMTQMVKPVKVKAVRTGLFGTGFLGGGKTTMDKRVWQVENPNNIVIPAATRQAIVAGLRQRGMPVTEQDVMAAYLRIEENP